MTTDLVARLEEHRALGSAPRAELEWLVAHGSLRHYQPGDLVSHKGTPVEGMFIVFSGRITISVDRGAGPRKILEWRAGDIAGLLPYSRLAAAPGDSVVEEAAEVLAIDKSHLRELTRECHTVAEILVHVMLDRARTFTSADLHDEKMVSLGKLSAGLAHELNNPASAIERSATLLENRLEENERATRALGRARLAEEQIDAIDAVRTSCVTTRTRGVRSPLEQGEREERMADWLSAHGVDESLADSLAETAVTFDALDTLAASVPAPVLDSVLRWVAGSCSVRSLASEIQEAATRISGLVMAIKGFTHMDQSSVAEPVDLARGLDNTVTVLRSKARNKLATVVVDVEPNLPLVLGFIGELNQIWSNVIDNALDAIPESGRVEIRVNRERESVVVRITDNGPGIPADIKERVFDPFFTTKPVGQGTGLGLDIVRRLVRHNGGDISVESQPGRTEFRIALPAVAATTA